MQSSHYRDVDSSLIDDFFHDFDDAYQRSEACLLALEHTPQSSTHLDDLFRSVHTIKGNLIYIGLHALTPLLQAVEDILEELRQHHLAYNDLLSDVVLLAMDATKALVYEGLYQKESHISDANFEECCTAIRAITQRPAADRHRAIYNAILVLDPNTSTPSPVNNRSRSSDNTETNGPQLNRELSSYGVEANPDLDFMSSMVAAIEQRSPYWLGRTRRIAKLALRMNDLAGRPVTPNQLTAAVYMHDINMAFLPLDILHKPDHLNSQEKRQVNSHVRTAHDLLHRMENWEEAAEVVLQHHEHVDGNGYPKGLSEAEICDGAKILTIADTFDACTHSRAHHSEVKRPIIRAVLEINRHAGSQFSQHWVDIFNKTAQQLTDTKV